MPNFLSFLPRFLSVIAATSTTIIIVATAMYIAVKVVGGKVVWSGDWVGGIGEGDGEGD